MILVPAGEFIMGSEDGESDEKPTHRVYLDEFYMDKYEVTTSHFAKFLEVEGYEPPKYWNEASRADNANRPVIGVEWEDANAYCQWVGKRLPTEAEWEKAARGTDGRIYPWGSEEPTNRHANFGKCCKWNGYETLSPVGSLAGGMSSYGIYDLAGNVWEWVQDWYEEDYYSSGHDRNPTGPSRGEYKLIRGGAWNSTGFGIRSTFREWKVPLLRDVDIGFRCAQDAQK